ncbi:MAG: rod shape-determining protein RodA [Myxococcales bacterium]|nr:MAG: rod shape-determining protein RodA [Myxococcales bacterium]
MSLLLRKDRRVAGAHHWPLILAALAVLAIGLTNLFSAAYATRPTYFFAQLAWTGLGLVAAAAVYAIDYRIYERLAFVFYAVVLVLLAAVLFTRPIAGSQRWITLGPANLQPSELMKLGIVLVLAKHFHDLTVVPAGYSLWELRKALLLTVAPVALILLEPDLGTAGLIGLVGGTILLFVKIRPRTLLALVLVGLILLPVGWFFVLKDYQKQRIETLFDPDSDPRGTGYHRRQSIIAVGSGQVFGKGFMGGTQTQLRFLPEQHTDFIFSVYAEERGFIGSFTLIMLYAALILSGIHISSKAREKFGALIVLGATAILFWQAWINIAMVAGIFPVVGVTLPLMSYGGTSLLVTLCCIALMLNVYARRHLF